MDPVGRRCHDDACIEMRDVQTLYETRGALTVTLTPTYPIPYTLHPTVRVPQRREGGSFFLPTVTNNFLVRTG